VRVAQTRVRRFKPHGTDLWIVCIHESAGNSARAYALTSARQVISSFGTDLAGFAVVAWGRDLESCADACNFDGRIPAILIPDFVRNRLLAQRIEAWTLDALNGR